MSESEGEDQEAFAALLCQQVIDDEEYEELKFGDLDIPKFQSYMDHAKVEFLDVVVAHVQGVLCAKGELIDIGLTDIEINQISKDLSDGWFSLSALGPLIYPGNEAVERNPINLLRQSIFEERVECVNMERYKITVTEENREVLHMMIEGAQYKKSKIEFDDAKRNQENRLPANRARYLHGCNFLHALIALTCDDLCMDKVLWIDVQNSFSKLSDAFQTRDRNTNNADTLRKANLYKKYHKVLGLDEYSVMNHTLIKYITGRKKAKDALCEPIFSAHIKITTTDSSGGFSVQIEESKDPYSKEDIDAVLELANPRSGRNVPMTEKDIKKTKKEEELEKRRANYVSKYSADGGPVREIDELPSTSYHKSAPSKLSGWDGTNATRDDDEDDHRNGKISRSGLAPEFTDNVVHDNHHRGRPHEPTAIRKSDHIEEDYDSDGSVFSSVGDADVGKDHGFSDEDNDEHRPKKKTSKGVRKPMNNARTKEKKGFSNDNNRAEVGTRPFTPAEPRRLPFSSSIPLYSAEEDENDSEYDEEELEDVGPADELIESDDFVHSNKDFKFDELDSEADRNDFTRIISRSQENVHSHQGSSNNRQPLEKNARKPFHKEPEPAPIVNAGSRLTNQRRPQVPNELHPDHMAQKQKQDDRLLEVRRMEAEEKRRKDDEARRELEMKRKEEELRQMELDKRRAEEELLRLRRAQEEQEQKLQKMQQVEEDMAMAKKLQDELDIEATRGGNRGQRNEGHGQRTGEYERRKEQWSDLGLGAQTTSGITHQAIERKATEMHGRPDDRSSRMSHFSHDVHASLGSFGGGSRNDAQSIRRIPPNSSISNHSYNNNRGSTHQLQAHQPYLDSMRGSPVNSDHHNLGGGNYSQHGRSFENGPPGNRAFSPESFVSAGTHVSRSPPYQNGMNNHRSLYGQQRPVVNPPLAHSGFEEYPRSSNGGFSVNHPHYAGTAPRPNRYDVPRAESTILSSGPPSHYMGRSGPQYNSSSGASTFNKQQKALVEFIESYLKVFGKPDSEVQWSAILKRCRSLNSTFRFHHPCDLFGPSFVDQLQKVLPKYISVSTLAACNEVIFYINPAIYPGFESLQASAKCEIFVDFVYKFLRAFDSQISLKWSLLREGIVWDFANPESYFSAPWYDHFTELAAYWGLPLIAERPINEVYLSIRNRNNR